MDLKNKILVDSIVFLKEDTFKETLINKGIADAFVVAFNNGERISINKAVELLK